MQQGGMVRLADMDKPQKNTLIANVDNMNQLILNVTLPCSIAGAVLSQEVERM